MIGLLLIFIAIILSMIIAPIAFAWSLIRQPNKINDYFYKIAVSIDQQGNVICATMFNDLLIKPNGFKFGNSDETISSVLGRNYIGNTLTNLGQIIRAILDRIENNHCINAIGK